MRILFVCTGNAFRSPVAEALLKKLDSSIDVASAGTNPGIPISTAAKKYLAQMHALRFLKPSPEGLNLKDLRSYDLIVAMESTHRDAILSMCRECAQKIVVWNVDDPYFRSHDEVQTIFDQIKNHIAQLVRSLRDKTT